MTLDLRAMRARDWPAVARVFEDGIETRQATFETGVPSWQQWDRDHHREHRLLAALGNDVVGWAALSPYSRRSAYAGVAEESVYVAAGARGRGVGRALLRELVASSERGGIWTLQAGIFPENRASLRLHHSCGFRTVGLRERLGRLDGEWRDVLALERRSALAGR